MPKTDRELLLDAVAAGDVRKIWAIKNRLPGFIVTYHGENYSFSIPYSPGTGNREERTGTGDWLEALTAEERELLDFDYGGNDISVFIVCIKNPDNSISDSK